MDSFRKLEQKFSQMPVHLLDLRDASGVIQLDGRNSVIHVTSKNPILFPSENENGFFDLRARSSDGREILLHNAIIIKHTTHSRDQQRHYSSDIFPNVFIDNAAGLQSQARLQRISFSLQGMNHFFNYQYIEFIRSLPENREAIKKLHELRYAEISSDNIFDPEEVYVLHRFPLFLDFRLNDCVYSVWASTRVSGDSWSSLNARVYPVATITFDEAVTLEVALDRVAEWRRFFVQMAMRPLSFVGVSVQARSSEPATANIYLPNLKQRKKKSDRQDGIYLGNIPLNSWADREKLAVCMRQWLSLEGDRRRFRVGLDHVIERLHRRIDPRYVLELTSAVESLNEFSILERYRKEDIGAMVDAAHAVASKLNVEISKERIKGLLGSLQRPSLKSRLLNLGSKVSPMMAEVDAGCLADAAGGIRHAFAHGGGLQGQIDTKSAATIEALTALCVRYDLESSGLLSLSPVGTRTIASNMLDEAMKELRRLGSR